MTPLLVGDSSPMRQLGRMIEKVAMSRAPVLLLGESGTGKELVARAIYDANPAGQFVPIDCGSLVGPLMESELFGHTKGAFTGAGVSKRGLIELADGGTAFFDEIGDLPLELQVKLLRLLQEREFRPVGSLERRKVDIRIIAATHRNLESRVTEGTFRQDLYYRLNVGRIRLVPLRERKDDIPRLANHFLAGIGAGLRLSEKALQVMLAYDWPGNVRELRNAIERMAMLNSGPWIDFADLPTAVQNHDRAAHLHPLPVAQDEEAAPVFSMRPRPRVIPLLETEKHAIIDALRVTNGDRGKAASLLQISRTTLYRKLKEYQIAS
jgi:sigma-54 dependent transcriptional regulator, flagellar regulatory protein